MESAFNTAQNFLNSLEMNLNINKCEFLSDREDEEITDNKTNIKLASTLTVKYLGQYIDSSGKTTNIINTFDYGTINKLVINNVNHISRRAKIKLFNT